MDYSILLNNITSWVNPTIALQIMGIVVGSTVGIFLAVWGGKKIINAVQIALTQGKISVDSPEEMTTYSYFDSNGNYVKKSIPKRWLDDEPKEVHYYESNGNYYRE